MGKGVVAEVQSDSRRIVLGLYRTGIGLSPKNFPGFLVKRYFILGERGGICLEESETAGKYLRLSFYFTIR